MTTQQWPGSDLKIAGMDRAGEVVEVRGAPTESKTTGLYPNTSPGEQMHTYGVGKPSERAAHTESAAILTLREALEEIAGSKALTTTPTQLANYLQDIARKALADNLPSPVAAPVVLVDRNAEALHLPEEWQGPWELQIDSHMTGREGVVVHTIGKEVKLEYTDGSNRWKLALPVPTYRDKKLNLAPASVPQPAAPQGYVIVPAEPTPSMLAHAIMPRGSYSTDQALEAAVTYRLMLGAAPAAPAVQDAPSDEQNGIKASDAQLNIDTLWEIHGVVKNAGSISLAHKIADAIVAAPVSGEAVRPDLTSLKLWHVAGSRFGVREAFIEMVRFTDVEALFAPDQTTGEKQ